MKLDNYKEDKIEIQSEQQQKKEIKLIGNQRKIPGLTLFEYDTVSKTLSKAEYKKVDFHLKSLSIKPEEMQLNHKVIVKENCLYVQALNEKNALKKVKKMLG